MHYIWNRWRHLLERQLRFFATAKTFVQTFVQNKPAAVIHQVFQIQKHFPRSPICKDLGVLGVQVSPKPHPNRHFFFYYYLAHSLALPSAPSQTS